MEQSDYLKSRGVVQGSKSERGSIADLVAFTQAYGAEDERGRKEGRNSEKATGV